MPARLREINRAQLTDQSRLASIVHAVSHAGLEIPSDFLSSDPRTERPVQFTKQGFARYELGRSIYNALHFWAMYEEYASDAFAADRYGKLVRISKTAKRLRALLDDDVISGSQRFARSLSGRGTDISRAVEELENLHSSADQLCAYLEEHGLDQRAEFGAIADEMYPHGASHHLITRLADAFRRHFRAEPHILIANSEEPYGPFVTFVLEIREAIGKPISPHGVKKAWDRAKGQTRKTSDAVSP